MYTFKLRRGTAVQWAAKNPVLKSGEPGVEVDVSCFKCAVPFGIPTALYNSCIAQGPAQEFFCPNGHGQVFRESELTRTQKRLASLQAMTDRIGAELRDERAACAREREAHGKTTKKLTRLKTRVAHGVCGACNRTFKNLADHMATRHKAFVDPNAR